jgi:diguanylate cyclase (GGDEF)-like protein
VSLVDVDRQWFKSMQGLEVSETPRAVAFCDHTIHARSSLLIEDALLDARFVSNPPVTGEPFIRAYAGAPLTTPDGYNLGALCAIDRRARAFSPSDVTLLERFARVVVDQMELRTLAHRDFLTGALTRRAFVDSPKAALHQLEPHGGKVTVAVLDVDHFKQINDEHGHPVGDKVLKEISAAIAERLRDVDLFGRLGGEEFGILFHGAAEADAWEAAERIRGVIASCPGDDCPPATVSIGLAELHRGDDFDLALARADAALFAAKKSGRNRSITASFHEQLAAA